MEEINTLNQEINESNDESFFEDTQETQEESLFDEVENDATPSKNETKEDKPQEEVVEQSNATSDTETFMTIRYNKEDTNLTKDKAIEMAQKGMNYDKVFNDFQLFKAQFEDLASRNGMDIDTYIANLKDNQLKFEIDKEIEELKKEYPNSDEGLIRQMAEKNLSTKIKDQESKNEEKQKANEQSKRNEIERQLKIAQKIYPNEDYEHLPSEVLDSMKQGYTIVESLAMYKQDQSLKIKEQEDAKAKASAKNEENKKKSLGNTNNASNQEVDEFMDGFFNA